MEMNMKKRWVTLFVGGAAAVALAGVIQWKTPFKAMLLGRNGWSVEAMHTVGEAYDGYQPVGILDGIGAYRKDGKTVRALVNHELGDSVGAEYTLANGTTLRGARVSYFDFDRNTRRICGAGPAYDTIYDRDGNVVSDASQIGGGLNRLCSSNLVDRGEYGFCDRIYFTGEETGNGTEYALDVDNGDLWACPDLGRAAWENVTAIDTGDSKTIALLIGDDTAGAPLYLYVGEKGPRNSDFLTRNGLKGGKLYVWVADNGDSTPQDFNGPGSRRWGEFVEIDLHDIQRLGFRIVVARHLLG
jgi:glycerophosphoryl diester phosphodiesterase